MPCYDGRDKISADKNGVKVEKYEAVLCAVFQLLKEQKGNVFKEFIRQASERSKFDVMKVYTEHFDEDVKRLKDDLENKYSYDERKMLKKILNQGD